MRIYRETFLYDDPFNIVFLCGSKFSLNHKDKRQVLKKHLEHTVPNCRVIILEENFTFRNTTKDYLSYDEIFLYSLAKVEELASLFSDSILIIHETISTAAELGMFANNPALLKKICLLTPDSYAVEENKVSAFIRLAFLQSSAPDAHIGEHIIFYPDTKTFLTSPFRRGYSTYFHDNVVGKNLSHKICSFVNRVSRNCEVDYFRCKYHKCNKNSFNVEYCVCEDENNVSIYIHPSVLRVQLLALFYCHEFQTEIKKAKRIFEHVSYFQKTYTELIQNSVAYYSGYDFTNYKVSVFVKCTDCDLRSAIGYYIYMLQAAKLVYIKQGNEKSISIRSIHPTHELLNFAKKFASYIINQPVTTFGALGI